jgi:hypothetical protein
VTAADEEFERLYGPWDPLLPTEVADYLNGFDAPWWVAGGWSIEAFTGVRRHHEDIDVSIFHRDLPRLRTAMAGRAHIWSAGSGALRPVNDDWPDLHPDASQVWLREHASAPWRVDVLVNPDDDGRWVNRRWAEHVAPLEEITWVGNDGVTYLNPEIALLFKAKLQRPKDDRDLDVAWPLLTPDQRAWLRDAVRATEGEDHPWLRRTL